MPYAVRPGQADALTCTGSSPPRTPARKAPSTCPCQLEQGSRDAKVTHHWQDQDPSLRGRGWRVRAPSVQAG
eukprot:CAMPEP_0195139700 /NCGR_PEP_ID=MMETSP0448-20130528/159854_1 /TAXON_ID=66468 /ORGANISM="Heterocapsa triquestra, Strain CCMP 448" /LENGTH=71 /DNA_ID=CAMNT_0040178015 /DNA_START=183 /DNA_END=394 /DNA_ORIENTATION=-